MSEHAVGDADRVNIEFRAPVGWGSRPLYYYVLSAEGVLVRRDG